MKKIFSLALVALMALSATAQERMSADLRSMTRNTNAVRVMPKLESKKAAFLNGDVQHKVVAEGTADTATYFPSWNVLKGGWDSEGYEMFPMLFQRHQDTVTFYNDSYIYVNSEFGWFMSTDPSDPITNDTNFVVEPGLFTDYDQYYEDMMPMLMNANGSMYYYGQPLVDLYSSYGYTAKTYWMSLPQTFFYPMTNCMLYTSEEIGGEYTENNVAPWHWDYENGGSYIFGTGFPAQDYPKFVQRGYTKMPDSLVVFFGYNDEVMEIDTVSLQFHSFTQDFLPAGSGITVQLFDHNGPIGQYTATAADTVASYVLDPSRTGVPGLYWTHGQLNFPIHCTAQGRVQARIYGFNQNGANIGFKADEGNYSSTTYHVVNGKLLYYWIANIAMTFNARFGAPTAIENHGAEIKATKSLKDGQLVIEKNGLKYNVLGASLK